MAKASHVFWSGALAGALCFAVGISLPRPPPLAEVPAGGLYLVHSVSWQMHNDECETILELSSLAAGASSSRRFVRVLDDLRVAPRELVHIETEAENR